MSEISFEELGELSAKYNEMGPPHYFYGGQVQLRFNQKQWCWYLVKDDGTFEPQYGVTGVVHVMDKSAALIGWAKKQSMAKLRSLMIERAGGGSEDVMLKLFIGDLDQIIKEAKQADEQEKDAAGDTGHAAHDWIENYIKAVLKEDFTRRDELLAKFPKDERAANCCIAALGWMSSHKVRWLSTERPVYSREYKCCGTCDGTALISSCEDRLCCKTEFVDRLSVVDWKTSNATYPYTEYLYQTGCYQACIEEETGERIEDRWIVLLGKLDGEFNPWHFEGRELFEEDWTGYRNCLRLYQSMEISDKRIGEIKGMRRALLREIEKAKKLEAMKIRCPKADDYKGSRKSKCLEDGSQCEACAAKYKEVQDAKGRSDKEVGIEVDTLPELSSIQGIEAADV